MSEPEWMKPLLTENIVNQKIKFSWKVSKLQLALLKKWKTCKSQSNFTS